MKNIEIKTPLADPDTTRQALAELGAREVWTRRQEDTFFRVERGWMKLREEDGQAPELVTYRRSTAETGPRASEYDLLPVHDAESWKRALDRVAPTLGVVSKTRTLWIWKNTRIHVDEVEELGSHLELETVVRDISVEEAHAETEHLIEALSLDRDQFLAVPYLEMLLARSR